MKKLRFLFALWIAKLSIPALKITRHQGTDFPGVLALKLCPDLLRYMERPKKIITVTGTNGKTTVCNLLIDVLEASGYRVMCNRAGANIISGISTAYIKSCTLTGRIKKYDIAVLEADERSSLKIYPYVIPDYVVVTNLTRDSIMRNAHPGFIAELISRALPKSAKLILNADDLISGGICPENSRVYFGIGPMDTDVAECHNLLNDMRICPRCSGKLRYDYLRYHHIGRAVCSECGFESPKSDYLAENVDFAKGTMQVREAGKVYDYKLITDSIFNVYNMITVIAVLRELGLEHAQIAAQLSKAEITSSRHFKGEAGGVHFIFQLSKENNTTAGSRSIDYVSSRPGRKEVVLMMNSLLDTVTWSENSAWLWDTDFELLNNKDITRIVLTGNRRLDYKLRALVAGIDESRIVCVEDPLDAAEQLELCPGESVYVLYGIDTTPQAHQLLDKLKQLAGARGKEQEAAR